MSKAALRKQFRLNGAASDLAAQAAVRFLQNRAGQFSVFCYLSMPGEPDTAPIFRFCADRGLPLYLPRCGGKGEMQARRFTGIDDLEISRFGIPEPSEEAEICGCPDMVIVPGLAFDRDGFRLGRGGGYYDRYLAQCNAVTIGLCREDAFVPSLPHDEWDKPVAYVAAGQGIWDVRQRAELP